MKNKKIKILALSLVGLFALVGCDEIVARPTNYNEPLIKVTGYDKDIYNNLESAVEDLIQKDGVGKDVLNEVLYLYAITAYGAYDATVTAGGVPVRLGEVTLSEAVNDETKIDIFVQNHKIYWDEARKKGTLAENAPATATEVLRVESTFNAIEERVAETMYNKIAAGAYSDRYMFSEAKFLKNLRSTLAKVADPDDPNTTLTAVQQILPEVEPKDVFDYYLTEENYFGGDNTYVVDELMPDIYRELLSELYVNNETYNTLGRSLARKVNIIQFEDNADYPNAAYYLATHLVDRINAKPSEYNSEIIQGDPASKLEDDNGDLLVSFKHYSNALVGVVADDSIETALLEYSGFEDDYYGKDNVGTYWKGTKYGDLAAKYVKMQTNEKKTDSSVINSFTDNNKYPAYVGLDIQKRKLQETDYTTNGWFIKNGGLTDLPESIRGRLFNIAVATGIGETAAEKTAMERTYDTVNEEWKIGQNENAYVCRINGHNYLKTASRIKGASITQDILHYDTTTKSYYIVEILEAVSASKLSPNSSNNYEHLRSAATMIDIINEVCKVVAKSDTYSTLATKKYLKEMTIAYHDDSVYSYFVTNYPELFE